MSDEFDVYPFGYTAHQLARELEDITPPYPGAFKLEMLIVHLYEYALWGEARTALWEPYRRFHAAAAAWGSPNPGGGGQQAWTRVVAAAREAARVLRTLPDVQVPRCGALAGFARCGAIPGPGGACPRTENHTAAKAA